MFGGGDDEVPPDAESQTQLVLETAKMVPNVLGRLIIALPRLFFETRKDAAAVFNAIVRFPIGENGWLPHVEFLHENPQLLLRILTASELGEEGVTGNHAASLTYGTMLREVARYEALCRLVLFSDEFLKMFEYMQLPTFELASDAAASFREILTRHKSLCAEFLERRYDDFFPKFNDMLEKGNYVTRRQSLKLLSELLLDRVNAPSMMKYISSVENMCLMMNLLRDEARSIQFETFHVFKVFVANPNKTDAVSTVLRRNRKKLIGFLANFQNDRDDEQFAEEKTMLTRLLERMETTDEGADAEKET